MGLLDDTYAKAKALAGLLADSYQTGAQMYFPNEQDVKSRPELAKGLLQFVPGPGDAISGYDAVQSAKQGNYGEAALNGIGLLPFIPAMGGFIRDIKPPRWNSRMSMPIGDWTQDAKPVMSEIRELLRDDQAKSAFNTLRGLKNSKTGKIEYAWPADAALHQDIGAALKLNPADYEHVLMAP